MKIEVMIRVKKGFIYFAGTLLILKQQHDIKTRCITVSA